jgi:hypothetical protein
MNWATKTTFSNCYHVIAGEEANPATHYIPDEYIQVHIRVTCYKMNYRGILLYVVNSNEKKVGAWDIPINEPPLFAQPWNNLPTHDCFGSVMHSSAEWKPYHAVVYFKAPSAGTGPITFRSLFKYGNANTGDFFRPTSDVVLQEGSPVQTTQTWEKSEPGQSCSQACGDRYCVESELQGLNSAAALMEKITPKYPCQLPLLSGCGIDGATFDPVNEYCYYNDDTCTVQGRTASSVSCDTSADGVTRFCPCDSEDPNPASHNAPGILAILLVIPLLFSGLNQRVFFGVLLVCSLVFGHNWVQSVSRSPAASTYRPCKPPLTDMPHAQVGPNQAFQVEWMQGHGDYTYFVIIHSKDADKLKLHTTTMLNDYIANAPNGTNKAADYFLQRFHLKSDTSLDNQVTEKNITNYFQALISVNDTRYIKRPAVFGSTGLKYQFQYRASELAGDARVSYKSAKYPWIEAVYKFLHSTLNAGRPDTANFYIPGNAGEGRYIVQYLWRGYYDCVDVDYKSTQVASVYGLPFNGTRWNRIDHCLFENVRAVYYSSKIYTDPKYCLNLCTFTDCFGVNVVPLVAPNSVYQGFKNENWTYPQNYGSDMYVPWNEGHFNNTRGLFNANAAPTKFMCYAVQPREFTDTTDEYTVSNDPEDPIFYSTCFYRYRGNLFEDYLNSTTDTLDIPWRYNDKCIDCASKTTNAPAATIFPKWKVPSVCVDCDKEPGKTSPPLPLNTLVETGVRCDGSTTGVWSKGTHHTCNNNGTMCWKTLKAIGRNSNSVNLDECRAIAAEDSECSNTYIYRQSASSCSCYTKTACCKTCSRRPDATYNTYELSTTADPTCATGIKSVDNVACCSSSCGVGGCVNATMTAVQDQVGFCCANCITRSCAVYGPPCKL